MPGYYDIYVLARERSAAVASQFLEEFAPRREQSAADYCFPQLSNTPRIVLPSADAAIRQSVEHPSESQSVYFRNLGAGPAHAMLFFTADGGLILGLSVEEGQVEDSFSRLREHADSQIGYVTFEEPPPETTQEFERRALTRG